MNNRYVLTFRQWDKPETIFKEENDMPVAEAVTGTVARITMSDFMTGLLAGLAKKDVTVVPIDGARFYGAVVDVFHQLEARAETDGLNLRFWLTQDEIHQDSPDIRDGISGAVQRRLVSLDNPTYEHMRMKISADEADDYLDALPGGRELYMELASSFKSQYLSRV